MDALGEVTDTAIGVDGRSKVEARIRQLEGGSRLKETAKSSAALSQVRATEVCNTRGNWGMCTVGAVGDPSRKDVVVVVQNRRNTTLLDSTYHAELIFSPLNNNMPHNNLNHSDGLELNSTNAVIVLKVRKYDPTAAQDAAPPAFNEAEDMVQVKKVREVVAVAGESSETPKKKKRKKESIDGDDGEVTTTQVKVKIK